MLGFDLLVQRVRAQLQGGIVQVDLDDPLAGASPEACLCWNSVTLQAIGPEGPEDLVSVAH